MDSETEGAIPLKERLIDLAKQYCIQVKDQNGKFKGNAFISEDTVFSAWHVVDEDWIIADERFSSNTPSFNRIGEQDLAKSTNPSELSGFAMSYEQGDGEEVYLVGWQPNGEIYSLGATIETTGPIHKGKMEVNIDRTELSELNNGMSGSSIVNKKGEVIGVLVQARMGGKGLMEPFRKDK